jgi:mRNA interferase MazF
MGSPAKSVSLRRGEIVLVPFPFTNLAGRKVRPALIVSPDPQGDDLVVAFISSVIPARRGTSEWLLAVDHLEFPTTGLKQASVFKSAKLLTLHRSLILRRLGHLGPTAQAEVDRRLLHAVGLAKS